MTSIRAFIRTRRGRYTLLGATVLIIYVLALTVALSSAMSRGVTARDFAIGNGDSQSYVSIAETMLEAHRYAKSPDAAPESGRLPGYPSFVAVLLWLFGTPLAVLVVQILCSVASALCIVHIGERLFSTSVGFIAAVLFALDPNVVVLSLSTLSDILFVFTLLISSVLLLDDELTYRRALFGGVILGACSLVRPVGIFLIPLFVLWFIYRYHTQPRRALILSAIILGMVALFITPWLIRNYQLTGRFTFNTAGTYNLLFYNAVEFEAFRTHRSSTEVRSEIIAQFPAGDPALLDSFVYVEQQKAMIRSYLLPHISQYAIFHIFKTAPFFIGSSIAAAEDQLKASGALAPSSARTANLSSLVLSGRFHEALAALFANPLIAAEQCFWILITVVMFASVCVALVRRSNHMPAVLFCAAIVGVLAILTGPVSMPRYRVPAEPFMLLLFSYACIEAVRFVRAWYDSRHV